MDKNTTFEFTDINKMLFATLLYRVVSVIIVIFTLPIRHTLPQWMLDWFRLVSYPLLIYSLLFLIFYKKLAEFLSKYFFLLFFDLLIAVAIIQIGGSWRSSYFGYTMTAIILFTIFDNKRGAYFSSAVLIIAAIIKDPAGGLPALETFQVNSWDMRLGALFMYLTTGLILGYISDLILKIEALSKARIEENEKLMQVRMGLELHDGAKPMVTAMIIKMHSLMRKMEFFQKDTVEDIQWLWRGMNYLQTELDQVINLLRTEDNNNNSSKIQPALCNAYEIAEESIKINGVMTDFSWEIISDSTTLFIPLKNKTSLRRFFNEAQINAWKHSGINTGTINLKSMGSNLEITIHDKGRGFIHIDSDAAKLMSLKHRAKELNGNLNIDTAPDKGCRLMLTFPVNN